MVCKPAPCLLHTPVKMTTPTLGSSLASVKHQDISITAQQSTFLSKQALLCAAHTMFEMHVGVRKGQCVQPAAADSSYDLPKHCLIATRALACTVTQLACTVHIMHYFVLPHLSLV